MIGVLLLVLATGLVAVNRKLAAATLPPQAPEVPSSLIERLPPLKLPEPGEKIVFFGDSWTQGYSAVPETLGYAYLTGQRLGAVTEVDADRGSGYVNNGAGGATSNGQLKPGGTYKQRLLARPADPGVRLLVLQGGINDLPFHGQVEAEATEAMKTAIEKYPNAQIVVLGPAPSQAEEIDAVRALSVEIMSAAAALGLYVVNPSGQGWITAHNMDQVIDRASRTPTTQGHAYLTDRLMDALDTLAREGQPKI